MIRNHLRIAWRNMKGNRINSFINIAGLATGITCVILIALYVQDERKFDRFYSHASRIYQVNLDANFGGQQFYTNSTPPPVGAALYHAYPEIKTFTRSISLGNQIVSSDPSSRVQNHFTEKRLFAVDSNYLQVFDYAVREGDPAKCLSMSHSIVITEKMARKYFGDPGTALGKTLSLDQYKQPFTVTAVLKDIPEQSSFQFDMLIPVADDPAVKQFTWSWVWSLMNTYVLMNDQFPNDKNSLQQLDRKFPEMVRVQAASAFNRIGQPFDQFLKKGGKWDFHLQPLREIHLHSSLIGTSFTNLGDIKYVYIFTIIAFFIIILACVNFMNLSTAQSAVRSKEVGIRKVMGSDRGQLIRQFLTEAMLYSFLATTIAFSAAALLIPAFNQVSGKALHFGDIFRGGIWIFILILTMFTGLLAGSYPAFYLTSFNPITVLKGIGLSKKGAGNRLTRNGLVTFQFAVSIALIICTILVFQQLQFARTMDLGLKKENVLVIPNAEKMSEQDQEAFRQEILKTPGVVNASISSDVPGIDFYGFTDFYIPNSSLVKEPLAKDITLTSIVVDEDFIPLLNIQMLKGRNFSRDFSDSSSVIINETTARQVGWKDPIGKGLVYPGKDGVEFKVTGVVKDFNVASIRSPVTPFGLFHASSKTYKANASYLLVQVRTTAMDNILASLKSKWKSFAAAVPFEYRFLDQEFESLYVSESRMGTVFGIFTGLSILVACLGLFGLAAFTAERRTKEIGLRKVLGASVQGLVLMLSRDFVKLVLLAAIISFPIAWWAMHKWLEDFAYRIPIRWWVFVLSASGALLIALFTISFQALSAALANPVKSLRTE
jgi:putative ABC transport system permease protein